MGEEEQGKEKGMIIRIKQTKLHSACCISFLLLTVLSLKCRKHAFPHALLGSPLSERLATVSNASPRDPGALISVASEHDAVHPIGRPSFVTRARLALLSVLKTFVPRLVGLVFPGLSLVTSPALRMDSGRIFLAVLKCSAQRPHLMTAT